MAYFTAPVILEPTKNEELGADWTKFAGRNGLKATTTGFAANPSAGVEWYNLVSYGPNCECWIELGTFTAGTEIAFAICMQGAPDYLHYALAMIPEGFEVIEYNQAENTERLIHEATVSTHFASGQKVALWREGHKLKAIREISGVETVLWEGEDSGITAGGYCILSIENGSSRVKKFAAQTLSSGEVIEGAGFAASAFAAMSGSGVTAFHGSGALSAAAVTSGSGSTVFNGAASIEATAMVSGAGVTVFNGAGELAASASAGGSGTVRFNGAGSLSGSASMTGTGAVTFSGAGALGANASWSGSGALRFNGAGHLSARASWTYTIAPPEWPPVAPRPTFLSVSRRATSVEADRPGSELTITQDEKALSVSRRATSVEVK